ncbi:MAG: 4-hydroxy-3-methylbut-2-enyl diphosphate reductase [Candidatus Marinimicrobia bacterium]|nr:4-hydroxy-3-methylbut-2-enyl diphosphate reductase [Candidatus Neomarinimicrobiota bacterium]
MKLKIEIAKESGFCHGVNRAVEIAKKVARKYGKVFMLGDIVHNEHVVKELESLGVRTVSSIEEIDKEFPVLLRSHGTPSQIVKRLKERKLKVIDATCPLVVNIHNKAMEILREGRVLIIVGDKGHEEVEAIKSFDGKSIVISGEEDIEAVRSVKKAGIVVQSTQSVEYVSKIVGLLAARIDDLRFVNTICRPTRNRQTQVKELAASKDVVLIVGSRGSANTRRLFEIANKINKKTYLISSADELKKGWFKGVNTVGISSGASTPKFIIDEIVSKIEKI